MEKLGNVNSMFYKSFPLALRMVESYILGNRSLPPLISVFEFCDGSMSVFAGSILPCSKFSSSDIVRQYRFRRTNVLNFSGRLEASYKYLGEVVVKIISHLED